MSTEVWRHLAAHHGVISRSEAFDLGITRSQLRTLVGRGEWVRVEPSVYRTVATPATWQSNARAAALSTGGVLSHRTAGVIWKIDGWSPGRTELTVPRARGITRSNTVIHESTQFELAEPVDRDGLPVTGIARTVLDIAAVVGPKRLQWTVDAVLRQGLLDWPDLYQVLIRHSRKGRDGCGKLRRFLDERYGETAIPDSQWNRMFLQLLTDAALPQPFAEFEIYDAGVLLGRVDIAYPEARLAIELDSVRWHLNHESFERDPRRKNRLMLAGWMVLTFTWADFRDRPHEVIRTIEKALARRSPAPNPICQ